MVLMLKGGTDTIKIRGCNIRDLNVVEDYTVIPDRIAAGTYLVAAAITRRCNFKNVVMEHMEPILPSCVKPVVRLAVMMISYSFQHKIRYILLIV